MCSAVRFDDKFIAEIKQNASANMRSTPKQIQFDAKIGKTMVENPDLSLNTIQELMSHTTTQDSIIPHLKSSVNDTDLILICSKVKM